MYNLMRRAGALISFLCVLVSAHQPVFLDEGDTTPAKGPLLKDGTVSFAVYAFVPEGETRGLRASFKKGDRLQFEILIPDKEPEKSYTNAELPTAVLTLPSKKTITVKPSERTYFFEPYSGRSYYYIARYVGKAEDGVTSISVKAKESADVVLGVGYREVQGEVDE